MKLRTRIRSVSKLQARRLRIYAVIRKTYLLEHPICEVCKTAWSDQVHHVRGRSGELLFATKYFKAMCFKCHDATHRYPEVSRRAGLLAQRGDWGRKP